MLSFNNSQLRVPPPVKFFGYAGKTLLIILATALFSVLQNVAYAQFLPVDQKTEAQVEVEAELLPSAQEPGKSVEAIITVEVPEGWYLYENMMGLEIDDAESAELVALEEVEWPASGTKHDSFYDEEIKYYDGEFQVVARLRLRRQALPAEHGIILQLEYQACTEEACLLPTSRDLALTLTILKPEANELALLTDDTENAASESSLLVSDSEESAEADDSEAGFKSETARLSELFSEAGLTTLLLVSFIAGLALSLTPCVYPMIPITVAVIGASSSESRFDAFIRSLIYVLGISLTYTGAGIIAAVSGAAFGAYLQHPLFYLGLGLFFALLALAMFGVFEVNIPMSWQSRLEARLRGKTGLLALLGMGLLSGVVVTSCAAPIVFAALGVVVASGSLFQGALIFSAIAWGMGVPLILAGTFSGFLKKLPKSGGWQRLVKYCMGAALVAAALYFIKLSALLTGSQFAILTAVVLLFGAIFIGAFDTLQSTDGWRPRLRKAVGLVLMIGAVYFVLPHLPLPFYEPVAGEKDEKSIAWITSIEEGVKKAGKTNKPMMIYFSTDHCSACRRLERDTFREPEVREASENFVNVKYKAASLRSEEVKKVLNRYNVRGFPTIVFADSEGVIDPDLREVRFLSTGEMLKLMEAAYERLGDGGIPSQKGAP